MLDSLIVSHAGQPKRRNNGIRAQDAPFAENGAEALGPARNRNETGVVDLAPNMGDKRRIDLDCEQDRTGRHAPQYFGGDGPRPHA